MRRTCAIRSRVSCCGSAHTIPLPYTCGNDHSGSRISSTVKARSSTRIHGFASIADRSRTRMRCAGWRSNRPSRFRRNSSKGSKGCIAPPRVEVRLGVGSSKPLCPCATAALSRTSFGPPAERGMTSAPAPQSLSPHARGLRAFVGSATRSHVRFAMRGSMCARCSRRNARAADVNARPPRQFAAVRVSYPADVEPAHLI